VAAIYIDGPVTWNGLSIAFRHILVVISHSTSFFTALKTLLFDQGCAGSVPE